MFLDKTVAKKDQLKISYSQKPDSFSDEHCYAFMNGIFADSAEAYYEVKLGKKLHYAKNLNI